MIPIYIAGPYRGVSTRDVEVNVLRACALGRFAASLGFLPVVPHAPGWLGVYGGKHDDKAADDLALTCGLGLLDMVARCDGLLWVIAKAEASSPAGYGPVLSRGCRDEVDRWRHPAARPVVIKTWAEWVEMGVVDTLQPTPA